MNSLRHFILRGLLAAGMLAADSGAQAQMHGPGWLFTPPGEPLSTQTAPSARAAAPLAATAAEAPWSGDVDADFATDDVKELARGLLYDPLRIFNYVRTQIEYEHYYGCKKGAAMTRLEGSGNDFDQCTLLVALLREAAAQNPAASIGAVTYKYGMMSVPVNAANSYDLAHWIGIADAKRARDHSVDQAGWPSETGRGDDTSWTAAGVTLARVWVEASIAGSARRLDPALKPATDVAGVDIASPAWANYSRGTILANAGGTVDGSGLSGVNVAAVKAELAARSNQLIDKIKETKPNADVSEIAGGRRLSAVPADTLADGMPIAATQIIGSWSEIPGIYASSIECKIGAAVWKLPMAELRGRRLSLDFVNSAGSGRLWLDDTQVATEPDSPTAFAPMTITIRHPHYYDTSPTHDQTDEIPAATQGEAPTRVQYKRSGKYALIYAFNASEDHIDLRRRKLETYKAAELADTSREVQTETLNIIGLQWMRQTELGARLFDSAANVVRVHHHRVGRMAQEAGFYVDVKLQFTGFTQRAGDVSLGARHFALTTQLWSAMEHGVIEQQQGASYNAVSTVDLISRALADSTDTVYLCNFGNWLGTGGVRSKLESKGYLDTELDFLKKQLDSGASILLPGKGRRTVGGWSGNGYASIAPGFVLMAISGNYLGGYAGVTGIVDPVITLSLEVAKPNYDYVSSWTPIRTSGDPVDLATGSFLYDHTDLDVSATEPRGISFSRHYSTRLRQRNDAKLGNGWLHNWYVRQNHRSATNEGLGLGNPYQCAAALVGIRAALDLYDLTDVKRWSCALLACGFVVDELYENSVSVQLGSRVLQFVKRPGGAGYLPPTGVAASLASVGANLEMTFRYGNTLVFTNPTTFGAQGKLTKLLDPYGKTLTVTYSGVNVSKVTDCFGRTLTFTYSGGRLTKVTDSTGRIVSFASAGDSNLTGCTDPEGSTWTFGYEDGHKLQELRDPDGRVITANTYDALDRVKEQRSQGDAAKTWKLFYSPDRTVETDPTGGQREFFYDEKQRLVAETDAMGRQSRYSYDGQDHQTSTSTPAGETTTFVYDGENNLLRKQEPSPTAGVPYVTQYFYDAQSRLDYVVDPNGKTTDYTFNTFHQPSRVQSPGGVVKNTTYYSSGVSAGLMQTESVESATGPVTTTYGYDGKGAINSIVYPDQSAETLTNDGRGDPITRIDPRGFTTSFTRNGRRQVTQIVLPGNFGYRLSMEYDSAGNLWRQTDQYGNVTTQLYSPTLKPTITTLLYNQTVERQYDARDWLETIRAVGLVRSEYWADGQVRYQYDELGRIRSAQTYDANGRPFTTGAPRPNATGGIGNTTQYYYPRGEASRQVDAAGKETAFTYDGNGNLRTHKNRRGRTWEFTYDDDNRLKDTFSPRGYRTQRIYDARGLPDLLIEPSLQTTDFTPDIMGRVGRAVDAVGAIDYSYDEEGRTDLVTETISGAAKVLDRDYDALGRLIRYRQGNDYTLEWIYHDPEHAYSLQYPDGKSVRYDFDLRGNLVKVKDWAGRVTTYTYDQYGRLVYTTRPNGTVRQVSYDYASQIVAIEERDKSGKVLASYGYPAYWGNGQVRKEMSLPPLPGGAGAISQPVLTYDEDNRLATWNGQAVTHDVDGNLTQGPLPPTAAGQASPGFGVLTFDARNRLITAGGATYSYNAENLRQSMTTAAGTTRWTLDPTGAPAARSLVRTKPDGTVTRYVWGLGLLYEEDQTTGETKTYHYDRRGSTVALTASDGKTVTDRLWYGPYGERRARTGTTDTPFQFNGFFAVQTDPNGLLQMGARYYDVEIRRFVSEDPMGFAESPNFYWFANGDPFSLADPFGLGAADTSANWWHLPERGDGIHDASVDLFIDFVAVPRVAGVILGKAAEYIAPIFSRAAKSEVTVYRVFGGDARAQGFSWTTVDPRTVSDFRNGAGLPSGGASGATNTADFLIQGKVNPADIIKSRSALPLDGNAGGLPELIIDPKNVRLNDFSVLNP
jgi:RHS repeat-associated protein